MRVKIKEFIIEIKYSFLIILIMNILSIKIRNIFKYYFACYMFIMFHEFSHIIVALIFNYTCSKIEFSMCGMCANIALKNKSKREIFIYLAGPLSNILFAFLFLNNNFIFKINLILALINLIPVFPLDGYRIFKLLNTNTKILENIMYVFILIYIVITKNFNLCVFFVYIIFLRLNVRNN